MSIYGLSPLGTELGPAGGPGLITVLGALPETSNSFLLVFDRYPDASDTALFYSAISAENYVLSAIDPTYASATTTLVPQGAKVPRRTPLIYKAEVDDDDGTQIRLYTDCKLEPWVEYNVEVSPSIKGANSEAFAGETDFSFIAPAFAPEILPEHKREERYRDLSYRIFGDEPGYRYDETGDIAIQGAALSLQKRIHRRIFSREGDYAWTTDYGAGVEVKALAKSGQLQTLADKVREQILREPDVREASVATRVARTEQGTFVEINAKVLREDSTITNVDIREPIG